MVHTDAQGTYPLAVRPERRCAAPKSKGHGINLCHISNFLGLRYCNPFIFESFFDNSIFPYSSAPFDFGSSGAYAQGERRGGKLPQKPVSFRGNDAHGGEHVPPYPKLGSPFKPPQKNSLYHLLRDSGVREASVLGHRTVIRELQFANVRVEEDS